MNKVLLYVGLAILLGTVTMVAPLALLRPSGTIPEDNTLLSTPEYSVTVTEPTEPSNQDRGIEGGGLLDCGNFSAQVKTPEPSPSAPTDSSEPVPEPDGQSQEPALIVRTADNNTDLSSVGLLTVPSFLVALGVFVYLRKRIS